MGNFLLGQPWALKLVWTINVQNYTILPATLAAPTMDRGEMRRRIVALLQDYPEGLTPAEIQELLGVDRSLADTCQGMLRYGLVQRVERGRYVAAAPDVE
jgi:predicted transcriptional regulator of viral defense system